MYALPGPMPCLVKVPRLTIEMKSHTPAHAPSFASCVLKLAEGQNIPFFRIFPVVVPGNPSPDPSQSPLDGAAVSGLVRVPGPFGGEGPSKTLPFRPISVLMGN